MFLHNQAIVRLTSLVRDCGRTCPLISSPWHWNKHKAYLCTPWNHFQYSDNHFQYSVITFSEGVKVVVELQIWNLAGLATCTLLLLSVSLFYANNTPNSRHGHDEQKARLGRQICASVRKLWRNIIVTSRSRDVTSLFRQLLYDTLFKKTRRGRQALTAWIDPINDVEVCLPSLVFYSSWPWRE